MRGDEEIPNNSSFQGEAPECVGTCYNRPRSDLKDATADQICREIQDYCESKALVDFCTRHGVNGAAFEWNPHLKCRRRLFGKRHQGKLYQQFWKAYHENPSLNLALAFHGTAVVNVSKILHHGLDPQFRRTQAFGRGEYLSKEPGLSATYGDCLLVFLLLMPKDHEKVYSQKDRDIIVVTEPSHQLPLGVLHFQNVDQVKIQYTQAMRLAQIALKQAAVEQDWLVTETQLRVTLTELFKNGQIEEAALKLKEATKYHKLSKEMEQELATLLHQSIQEEDICSTLFPRLVSIPLLKEGVPTNRPSVLVLEARAREAWRAFLAMKMDPNRNLMGDLKLLQTTTCAQQLRHQQQVILGARALLKQ